MILKPRRRKDLPAGSSGFYRASRSAKVTGI